MRMQRKMGRDREKWMKHYASFHHILLVGDGDFSFSLCLAQSFGSASNIVASSLDPYDVVIKKYKKAKVNLEKLKKLGAILLHGVDATRMKLHPDLRMQKFDRIIFNFPHAGFHGKEDKPHIVGMHRNLLLGFFRNASRMLRTGGEVHVTHKTTPPFSHWNLEELASRNFLILQEYDDFKIEDYPGYSQKRGDGPRCDDPFPMGKCSTFKFKLNQKAISRSGSTSRRIASCKRHQRLSEIEQRSPNAAYMQSMPPEISIRNECYKIFGWYFYHAVEMFGRIDYDVGYCAREALSIGFEEYMAKIPAERRERSLSGYIDLLEELLHMSSLRSDWLQKMLMDLDIQGS